MKDTVVLYHASCNDGFTGAWVAREKFGKTADYIAISHQDAPLLGLENKAVYMIDIIYPEEDVKQLIKETKSFTVLDHHITEKKLVESVPDHMYAIDKSGATLAWKYFFPEKDAPTFLQYIEDIDLWNHNMPRSKDFDAFSMTLKFDFDRWSELVSDFEDEKKRIKHLDYGRNIREYQEKMIGKLVEDAEEVTFEKYNSLASNSALLHSQLGNAMVKKGYDIGIIWRHIKGDLIRVSLRSEKDGNVDVSKIAEKYGGGGHQSAAAFSIKEGEPLPWQTK